MDQKNSENLRSNTGQATSATTTSASSLSASTSITKASATPGGSTTQPVVTSVSSNTPNSDRPGLPKEAVIGISIGTVLGAIILAVLGILLWLSERRCSRKSEPSEKKTRKRRREWFPYFQQKGELDAEESRRNESEALGIQRELDSEERHELLVHVPREELRGDECATELDVAGKAQGSDLEAEKVGSCSCDGSKPLIPSYSYLLI